MKNTLTILIAFSLSVSMYAQNGILKTIGGAAKNKLEQQDFNSTRNNKEKGNLQDEKRSAPAPASSSDTSSAESSLTVTNVTAYENSYSFDQQFTYEIEDPADKKNEKQQVTYGYSETAIYTRMSDTKISVITDVKNEAMITFDEEEKAATVMSSRWMSGMMEKQMSKSNEASSKATVTRTGQTKKILGYTCEEYIIQDEKSKTVCWITKEIEIDYMKTFGSMSKGTPVSGLSGIEGQGMLMEMTGYDKKGEADVHMIMTEYKKETLTKKLGDYKVTAL